MAVLPLLADKLRSADIMQTVAVRRLFNTTGEMHIHLYVFHAIRQIAPYVNFDVIDSPSTSSTFKFLSVVNMLRQLIVISILADVYLFVFLVVRFRVKYICMFRV